MAVVARVPRMPLSLVVAAVVVTIALAVVLVHAALSAGSPQLVVAAMIPSSAVTVALAIIDARTHRLPNALVLPSIAILGVSVAADALLTGSTAGVARAVLGGAAPFLLFLLIAMVSPRMIGGGDVKLIAFTGALTAWVGWSVWLTALAAAFLLAGVVSIVLLMVRIIRPQDAVAFGPFLCGGAWIALGLTPMLV